MASGQLRIALALSFGLPVSLAGAAARSEDGVSDHKTLFGQVAALSGPAQDLGEGVRLGILTAFGEANRHGGVAGRQLDLLSLDDGYEPEETISATKELIEKDEVFALGSNQVFFTIMQADGSFKPVDRLAGMAGQ